MICAAPAAFLHDRFDGFYLRLDDFVYVAESRTASLLLANLWKPHNAHVVPLFRLLTFGLVKAAGSLVRLIDVFHAVSYAVLVLLMLAVGVLVARETGRVVAGLLAMVLLGLSSVIEPAATWYSASQTLWAALLIVLMLLALQAWCQRGSVWRLVLAGVAAFGSPLVWSGGFAAGPVGLAYLLAAGPVKTKLAGFVPMGASLLAGVVVLVLSGAPLVGAGKDGGDRSSVPVIRPLNALVYTAQAVPEDLVFRNLGLNVSTDATQGVVLCIVLVLAWSWSRGGSIRPNSLEAAGAVMAVVGFELVFLGRGYELFETLRGLGWYRAIPAVGAVIFLAGWCGRWLSPVEQLSGRCARPTRVELAMVLAFAGAYAILQWPLVEGRLIAEVQPLSRSELETFPEPYLQRMLARYVLSERAARQERFLGRLDGAERTALKLGFGKDAIRAGFGRIVGPGMPRQVEAGDAIDLLAIPRGGSSASAAAVRSAFGDWLTIEAVPKPEWIRPDERWPPERER
jgi:hypothetical protein